MPYIGCRQNVCLNFIIAVKRIYFSLSITFRLKNGVMVSRDRVVTGAREQVVSIAVYKCLNSNLF